MEFWEFLIQKEGDRSWLPLESPDVEVLEGRYRVVARTHRVNTAVEIRISHVTTAEHPPKRRIQKRSGQTNQDGLIVVIPFTRLQPGLWELRCTGDLMADLMGDSWQRTVKLQVLSHDTATAGDWEPDWHPVEDVQQTEIQHESSPASAQSPSSVVSVSPPDVAVEPVQPPAEPAIAAHSTPLQSAEDEAPPPKASPEVVSPIRATSESRTSESESLESNSIESRPEPVVLAEPIHEAAPVVQAPDTAPIAPATSVAKPKVEPVAPQSTRSHAEQLIEQAEATEANTHPSTQDRPAIADSDIWKMATQMSEELVNSMFQELDDLQELDITTFDVGTSEPVPEPAQSDRPIPSEATLPADDIVQESAFTLDEADSIVEPPPVYQSSDLPIHLTLDRDTYIARRGEALVLSGRVEPNEAAQSMQLPHAQLHVYLRDPQTAHVLVTTTQPLSGQALPLTFDCAVSIPSNYQTRLLLGELILVSVPQGDEPPLQLASQSFQVTAELNELLEAIANAAPDSDEIHPSLDFSNSTPASLDLTFLEFLQSPKPILQFQPSDKDVLPPQLQTSKPSSNAKTIIHFSNSGATFSISQNSDQGTIIVSPEGPAPDTSPDMLTPSSDAPSPSLADILVDDTLVDDRGEKAVTPGSWDQTSTVRSTPPLTPKPTPISPVSPQDAAFHSLNLKGRFWSRLNALATDPDSSSWLRDNPIEPSPVEEAPIEPLPVGDAPLGLDTDLAAQEVVVEDEPPPPLVWTASAYQPPQKTVEPPKPLVLPEDEPVPMPELDVPTGELTSGQSLFVTVKLPNLKPRIYVKLWIRDRQTRSLLDGPRWLVAFVSDGRGYLETRTQLTVPYGCLEAQFEAIAVEMATQRESNKVTIDRSVMPPDLPSFSLDDLSV
jgi:hypothetical protein